jgi:hypothetical protein
MALCHRGGACHHPHYCWPIHLKLRRGGDVIGDHVVDMDITMVPISPFVVIGVSVGCLSEPEEK